MRVLEVTSVSVIKLQAQPLQVVVQAIGRASTAGWSRPSLDDGGDADPADGVLELGFEADRPQGPVVEVLTPIAVSRVLDLGGATAVIVSSRTNSITVHVSEFIRLASTIELTRERVRRCVARWSVTGKVVTLKDKLKDHNVITAGTRAALAAFINEEFADCAPVITAAGIAGALTVGGLGENVHFGPKADCIGGVE